MALIDAGKLDKLLAARTSVAGQASTSPQDVHSTPENSRNKFRQVEKLFSDVVRETWESSGLRDLNAFTTCMVIRAAGYLVSAGELTSNEAKKLQHVRPNVTGPGKVQLRGAVEEALRRSRKPLLADIITAVAKNAPDSFSIPGYPAKTTMAYWFVDGITRANIEISTRNWKKIATWAAAEFDRQLTYVVSDNDPLMDPAALAMAACLVSRIRKTCAMSNRLSGISKGLPSTVELMHAVHHVFNKQTASGIWHKYFPLFHFPKSGAADYCFSFEFLEAILIEFSEREILRDPQILPGIERALRWCDGNRFIYREGRDTYHGWNAGGDVKNLAAGMPEAWATASVHMFLSELEAALCQSLQKLILVQYRGESPPDSKWKELIDVQIRFPKERRSLKRIADEHLIRPAGRVTEEMLRKAPLRSRRSALLFGPPGTSKTTFVKAVAGRLGWPLVVITPSDFLSMGLEQIYVRATEIFQDLMDLSAAVILFDEMDALAQTRGGNAALDVTRQLLTTSMLPKLADLHDWGRVIFLMATNHQKDLDPAITRAGRFDFLLCVGPPSWSEKLKRIEQVVKGLPSGDVKKLQTRLAKFSQSYSTKRNLDLFTVADLRNLLEHLRRRERAETHLSALENISKENFKSDVEVWNRSYITLNKVELTQTDTKMTLLTEYEKDKSASRIQ
jgi:hypothetical protein